VNDKRQGNGENPEYSLLRPFEVDCYAVQRKEKQKSVSEEASKTCPRARTGS
jgi:hypothetical protein